MCRLSAWRTAHRTFFASIAWCRASSSATRSVITLPTSARTVPTRGPLVPFYDVTVVHDPLPTKFSLPLNFDVISDVTPANSARTFHEEPNVTTIEFRVWVKLIFRSVETAQF